MRPAKHFLDAGEMSTLRLRLNVPCAVRSSMLPLELYYLNPDHLKQPKFSYFSQLQDYHHVFTEVQLAEDIIKIYFHLK